MEFLNHITTFVRVAEARGFTTAARRLGISTAAVSKSVARLEDHLGVKLFNRTTRSISLTDDGEMFFQRCRDILSDLEGAKAAVMRASVSPRGKLRVHSPIGLGRRVLVPSLSKLTQRYPKLTIDVDLSDRTPDLAEEGIDAALRVGAPADSRLIARPMARSTFVTCASPDYLKEHGVPQTPDDLVNHNCLAYVVPQTGRYHDWQFQNGARHVTYTPTGTVNVNNAEALLDAVIEGAGITRVASFLAVGAVKTGQLKIVLADWVVAGPVINLVYLQNRHLSPRVRAFSDAMTQVLSAEPTWDTLLGLNGEVPA